MAVIICTLIITLHLLVKGSDTADCLENGNGCSANGDCCSGNCTFDAYGNQNFSCQPLDVSVVSDKTKLLDFSSFKELGLKGIRKAEAKVEEVKNAFQITKSKLKDLQGSLKTLTEENLGKRVNQELQTVSEALERAKQDAAYNAECLQRMAKDLTANASEAVSLGVKCSFYAATQAASLGLRVTALENDLKTGLAKTGGKVLLNCTRDSLRFGGFSAKQCAQTAVNGVIGYIENIFQQVLEIKQTLENLVANTEYCGSNAMALVDKFKQRFDIDIALCKH